MTRHYRVVHRTRYGYPQPVTASYGRAALLPRHCADQRCTQASVTVQPAAAITTTQVDHFGNRSTYFEVHEPHTELVVTASSLVQIDRRPPVLAQLSADTWEQVVARTAALTGPERLEAVEGRLPSPLVELLPAVDSFARSVFRPGRPIGSALQALMHEIYTRFTYATGATEVSTPLSTVLRTRQGVCQDFAHVAVAAARSVGLAARYVSGYLETSPPPGQPRLQGADASHAWVAVLVPPVGWIDLDPTNDQVIDDSYVVTAWGRDYGDVPPLKGVIFTDSTSSTLDVAVDVLRV